MEVHVELTKEPIPEQVTPPAAAMLGAWVEFRGLVRGEENGKAIAALDYEAYEPMAEREMRRLLAELSQVKSCLAAQVIHRLGVIPVGEAAIYVGIAGRHRAEAFALLADFMDRLKAEVPIWKSRALQSLGEAKSGAAATAISASVHSAAEVLNLLAGLCQPLEIERVQLNVARGRVLREAVRAPEDQPAFDRSSVDGYAIRLDDPSANFHIVDEIRAGDWKPRRLQPGETVRIATGGALPAEDLQVVMREDVQVQSGTICVQHCDRERNIRFRGEDAQSGLELVGIGTVLSPGAMGLLASVGCTHPRVTRLPKVLHLATGNEIVPPGQMPARGQIRDSNSTLVREFLGQWGIVPEQRRVAEDEATIGAEFQSAKAEDDLLLISGGASVGEHDFTRRLLESAGFKIHVSKTTARPGKPLIVAQRQGTLAFGLPGNPLAHFVCLNLYVRAALAKWSGAAEKLEFRTGQLESDLVAGGNSRETFWPARWTLADDVARLTPLRWRSSGDLTALASANALIRVPGGMQELKRGRRVEFWLC